MRCMQGDNRAWGGLLPPRPGIGPDLVSECPLGAPPRYISERYMLSPSLEGHGSRKTATDVSLAGWLAHSE